MSNDVSIETIPQTRPGELNKLRMAVFSIGHGVADMYFGMLSPLWPLLIDKLHLSLTSVGAVTSITGFLIMPVQPITGWLVDRHSHGWFPVLGLIGVAVSFGLIGLVPSIGLLILCILCGRFANAIFHPESRGPYLTVLDASPCLW